MTWPESVEVKSESIALIPFISTVDALASDTTSTILPVLTAESNTIDVPSVAVKSFPVASLAPFKYTSTLPTSYANVVPDESAPLTESDNASIV